MERLTEKTCSYSWVKDKQFQDFAVRLQRYEDLEEQGLLARLKSHAVWCKDCKWFYKEACSNGKSDWCTDFPSEYNSCEFCEAKENDNEID